MRLPRGNAGATMPGPPPPRRAGRAGFPERGSSVCDVERRGTGPSVTAASAAPATASPSGGSAHAVRVPAATVAALPAILWPMRDPSSSSATPPPRALLAGASGQIGQRVLARLLADGWQVTALSRQQHPAQAGVAWRQATLPDAGPGQGFDAVLSCGPLDLFSQWYAATATGRARVVA